MVGWVDQTSPSLIFKTLIFKKPIQSAQWTERRTSTQRSGVRAPLGFGGKSLLKLVHPPDAGGRLKGSSLLPLSLLRQRGKIEEFSYSSRARWSGLGRGDLHTNGANRKIPPLVSTQSGEPLENYPLHLQLMSLDILEPSSDSATPILGKN